MSTSAWLTKMLKAHSIHELEKIIQHKFKNRQLALSALTLGVHPHSQSNDFSQHNNKRLEFLGDRVLNLCAAMHSLSKDQALLDMQLSLQKSINNRWLYQVAVKIGLPAIVIDLRGNLLHTGINPEGNPKRLADVVEAVLAAVYIDSDFDIKPPLTLYCHWQKLVPPV